jgi:hypothetical protein
MLPQQYHNRMRLLESHLSRLFLWSALLAILMLSGGCQTAAKWLFTASGPGWHVQEGQTLWRRGRGLPELGGDLVVARHEDGRCLIRFDKTPLSLVSVQSTRNNWVIQYSWRRIGFSGHRVRPARFAWLYLCAALSGEQLPPPLRFERRQDGSWRLENTRTGETLEGYLSP